MRIFRHSRFGLLLVILLLISCKQRSPAEFISVNAPIVALTHVRVIDGTGSPAREEIDEKYELDSRMKDVLSEAAYADCVASLTDGKADPRWSRVWEAVLKKEMQFEREFVNAGGLLMSGVDLTGWGGVIAGFGDQRGLELLVKAGFSPEEAIRIGTLNGATFLGDADRIGTLAAGKQADIVIVRGDPDSNITAIREVKLVFKDGTGYDPTKLIESVRGLVGER